VILRSTICATTPKIWETDGVMRSVDKWEAAGNDFFVDVHSEPTWAWNPAAARELCDRHRGFGADGLLEARVSGDEVCMRLWNADGSVAEMSGNGLRCLAAATLRARGDSSGALHVLTEAGPRDCHIALEADRGWGTTSMGEAILGEFLETNARVAQVGNPHVVVRDDASWSLRDREALAEELSRRVGGANVEFVTVIDRQHLVLTVIERGVGWTLACGTGSVASAAVFVDAGEVTYPVTVSNPGGDLLVCATESETTLSGPVRFIGTLTWDVE
jgi:diaminopimelate epimerase